MEELWKDIHGYEGFYQVSNVGRVKSMDHVRKTKSGSTTLHKGKKLKPVFVNGRGNYVALCKCGVSKSIIIARLVAEAFLERIEGCNIVIRIDGDRRNDCASNLKWGKRTISENLRNHFKKKAKAVIGYSESEDNLVCYPSLSATRKDGFIPSHVLDCCNGKLAKHKGYKWEFVNEIRH